MAECTKFVFRNLHENITLKTLDEAINRIEPTVNVPYRRHDVLQHVAYAAIEAPYKQAVKHSLNIAAHLQATVEVSFLQKYPREKAKKRVDSCEGTYKKCPLFLKFMTKRETEKEQISSKANVINDNESAPVVTPIAPIVKFLAKKAQEKAHQSSKKFHDDKKLSYEESKKNKRIAKENANAKRKTKRIAKAKARREKLAAKKLEANAKDVTPSTIQSSATPSSSSSIGVASVPNFKIMKRTLSPNAIIAIEHQQQRETQLQNAHSNVAPPSHRQQQHRHHHPEKGSNSQRSRRNRRRGGMDNKMKPHKTPDKVFLLNNDSH